MKHKLNFATMSYDDFRGLSRGVTDKELAQIQATICGEMYDLSVRAQRMKVNSGFVMGWLQDYYAHLNGLYQYTVDVLAIPF